MDKSYSLFLDLIRFLAALAVLFHHAEIDQFKVKWLSPVASFGHDAVIVFFILSGFVISYVADTKERTWQAFTASRLARILSVSLPAISLTALLIFISDNFSTRLPDLAPNHSQWTVLINSIIFLNQTTLSGDILVFNGPYWSINYEVWYYIIFGIALFSKGLTRITLLSASVLVCGVKIIALLPIWLLGIILYKSLTNKPIHKNVLGLILIITASSVYVVFRSFNIDDLIYRESATIFFGSKQAANTQLAFSKLFIRDYVIATLVYTAFYGAFLSRNYLHRFLSRFEEPIRAAANTSFTLYLFHWPLLTIFSSFSDNSYFILAATIVTCYLISILNNKLWIHLRRLFNNWLIPENIKGNPHVNH